MPDLLLVGRIGKPHGISGEVYVERISDDPLRFEAGSRLTHEDGRELVIESARPHRTRFLVKFSEVDDREAAESLKGSLYVSGSALRNLDENEFWQHDLIGCTVVTSDGKSIGPVADVINNPGQDLLSIETASGPVLVPLVKEIVVSVDVSGRKITIDPPEGLLE